MFGQIGGAADLAGGRRSRRNTVVAAPPGAAGSGHVHEPRPAVADRHRHRSGARPTAARPTAKADAAAVMTAALVAGLLAGYGIAVPVGAVATYLVSLTARTSLRTGVCAALGVATADGLYALLAGVGGAALAAVLRPFLGPLRWVSAAVLLALAARGA